VKALKDGKTAKDWKDCVNTNSDRRSSKADKSKSKRRFHDKKEKGGKYENKYGKEGQKKECWRRRFCKEIRPCGGGGD
jgi:hypothetical protein